MSLSNRNAPDGVRGTSVGGSVKSTSYVSGRGLLTSTASGSSKLGSDRALAAAGASSDAEPRATRRDIAVSPKRNFGVRGSAGARIVMWSLRTGALRRPATWNRPKMSKNAVVHRAQTRTNGCHLAVISHNPIVCSGFDRIVLSDPFPEYPDPGEKP